MTRDSWSVVAMRKVVVIDHEIGERNDDDIITNKSDDELLMIKAELVDEDEIARQVLEKHMVQAARMKQKAQ